MNADFDELGVPFGGTVSRSALFSLIQVLHLNTVEDTSTRYSFHILRSNFGKDSQYLSL